MYCPYNTFKLNYGFCQHEEVENAQILFSTKEYNRSRRCWIFWRLHYETAILDPVI